MKDQKVTIAELGRKTGIPRSSLSKIINDVRHPLMAQVRTISIALGVPLPQLMRDAEGSLEGAKADVQVQEKP